MDFRQTCVSGVLPSALFGYGRLFVAPSALSVCPLSSPSNRLSMISNWSFNESSRPSRTLSCRASPSIRASPWSAMLFISPTRSGSRWSMRARTSSIDSRCSSVLCNCCCMTCTTLRVCSRRSKRLARPEANYHTINKTLMIVPIARSLELVISILPAGILAQSPQGIAPCRLAVGAS